MYVCMYCAHTHLHTLTHPYTHLHTITHTYTPLHTLTHTQRTRADAERGKDDRGKEGNVTICIYVCMYVQSTKYKVHVHNNTYGI